MLPLVPPPSRTGNRAPWRVALLLLGGLVVSPRTGLHAAPAAGAGAGEWTSLTKGLAIRGASSVRITQRGPEVWYASILGPKKAGGVCESTTKGAKWTPRMTGLEEVVSERDSWRITIDPKDDKTLYAVGRGKIYKSTNSAATWEFAGNGTATYSFDRSRSRSLVEGVEVDPSNSKRLLAGTRARGFFGGLFESKDGARSWTQIAGTGDRKELEQSGLGADAWPISLDRASDKYILVGGRAGSAWLSENRGGTFKATQPGGLGVHRAYELTPMIGREVFLAESRGLWRSRDAGESWGKAPILAGTCISVDVDAGNRKIAYAVLRGKGLFRTENLTTWTAALHPEIEPHEVVCHPHAKNTILIASHTTGLWISADKGETVTPLFAEMPTAVPAILCLAAHSANPASWLAAADHGAIFASADRGATWAKASNLGVPVSKLVADPASPTAWVAAGPGIYASSDGGATWTTLYAPADPEERVAALERLADGTWLALLEREARVLRSRDGGKTWDKDAGKRPQGTKTAWGTALAVDPRDPNHLLVATRSTAELWSKDDKEGGPYESKDAGLTWTLLDAGFKSDKGVLREGWNQGAVCGIDANHGTLFYGADGAGLFRLDPTPDGKPGAWVEAALTGAPAQASFNAFLISPSTPDTAVSSTIVVQLEGATTRSLLRSLDAGRTFASLPDPGTRLASISEDPALAGRWLTGDPVGDRGVLAFDPPGGVPALQSAVVPVPAKPGDPPAVPEASPVPPEGLRSVSGGKDKTIRAIDLHAGSAAPVGPAPVGPVLGGEVLAIVASKDGKRLFVATADKAVSVLDASTGGVIARLEGAAGAVQSIAVSGDGATVYAGDSAFGITVFDVGTGKATGTLAGHTGAVNALVLCCDGAKLYSGSADRSVRAWDTTTKKELYAVPGHPGEVYALSLSGDETRLYVGGRDASIRVYDTAMGAPVATWTSPGTVVETLSLSPEGSVLYTTGGGKELLAVGTGDGLPMIVYKGATANLTCVAVSADGEWIVAGGEDGLVRAWKKGRAEIAWTSTSLHEGAVRSVVLTPGASPAPPTPAPAPAPAPAPPPGMNAPPAPGPAPAPAPGMNAPPAAVPTPAPDAPKPPLDGGMR